MMRLNIKKLQTINLDKLPNIVFYFGRKIYNLGHNWFKNKTWILIKILI